MDAVEEYLARKRKAEEGELIAPHPMLSSDDDDDDIDGADEEEAALGADEEEDDVGAAESFRDGESLLPLMKFKRFKALSDAVGFTQVQTDVYRLLDRRLKAHLRELVGRSKMAATCHGRKQPNEDDATAAVQQTGYYGPIIIGH